MEKLYELDPVVLLPVKKLYELESVVSEYPPRWLFSSPSPDLEHGADEAAVGVLPIVCWASSPSS